MSPIVALVTDFGRVDSYVAEMHIAVARRVPGARLLDVTHDVPAFDRVAGALAAERALRVLPRGSALVVVIDPGVGSSRARIFGLRDGIWIVGPDNGTLPLRPGVDPTWRILPRFCAPGIGVTTFDGREVFAPVAALLSAGLSPSLAGEPLDRFEPSVIPDDAPFVLRDGAMYAAGVVLAVDRYGNAVTNIRVAPDLAGSARCVVTAPTSFAGPLRTAYAEVAPGQRLALVGSSGRLELAVREGASGLAPGEEVTLRCEPD